MRTSFLEAFLLTVDTGSMAEAARRLDLTPAAVAQQLRSLEAEMGVALLARVGKTVRPTEAGHRVLERCRALVRDTASVIALATQGELSGELRIGAVNTALNFLLPDVLAALTASYPDLRFYIQSALSSELFDLVQRGELDAAVCLHPQFVLPKTCGWQLLREEELIALAPLGMAGKDPHTLLQTMPFIRYDRNQWGGQQAERYLRRVGIAPRERYELSNLAAIISLVGRGLGVALVPDAVLSLSQASNVTALALPVRTQPRQLGVLWQRSSVHEKLIRVFTDQAKALCQARP
jgi:DNA-binding transcriptional LysR family regulator